jgi:hypothetical protein
VRLTEKTTRMTMRGRGYIDDARSRRGVFDAVLCARANHRWLRMPLEGEKKRVVTAL